MKVVKLVAIALILPLNAVGLSVAGGHGVKDLLFRTLLNAPRANFIATVLQGPGRGRKSVVQHNRQGQSYTVYSSDRLEPNVEVYDDSVVTKIYYPKNNEIIIRPSAETSIGDATLRTNLAATNYRLELNRGFIVAGRRALLLEAVPHSDKLDTRRMFLDEETGVLLKLEIMTKRGPLSLLDTLTISFPSHLEIPEPAFLNLSVPRKTFPRPEALFGPDIVNRVGFTPVLPSSLPFGFVVQQAELAPGHSKKVLAIRITDGLVKATVYQWRKQDDDSRPQRDRPDKTGESGGLKFMVAGALPDSVKDALLSAFLTQTLVIVQVDSPSEERSSAGAELSGAKTMFIPNIQIKTS